MKAFRIVFGLEIAAIGILTALLFVGEPLPEVFSRPVHRLLHIFGAILFLGNIIVSALWFALAGASRNAGLFMYAARLINLSDLIFTGPGLILLLANGAVLAVTHGTVLEVFWLKWALIWFMLAGALWILLLIPLQLRFLANAELQVFPWNEPREKFYLLVYSIAGSLTVFFVLISFGFMVLR